MLSGGATVSELSMSPVEAMLIDQRRLDREEVAIVLDLAGPSLSDTTDASMGNVVERMRSFYRDVLPPWTTLVVETLESQLVEPEADWLGHVVRFDFSDKLRGEPNEQATTLKVLVEAGLLARNEARIELGRPPEGDPTDPANPANQLTVNANNQNTLAALGSSGEPPQDP
jgi:HK97 family phage portal protein